MKILVLMLLCVCFSFSCQKTSETISSDLAMVDSIMWNYPDSALILLEKISRDNFHNKLEEATWCLLYTQAQDKKYIKHLSDSLINIALTYFDLKDDWRRKSQAWFYKGQVLQDMGRKEEAVACYVQAKDLFGYFHDPLFASLVCRSLGSLYRNQKLYDESLELLKEGVRYASQVPKDPYLSQALSELGRTYAECAEWDSARYYFECSLENAELIKDAQTEAMAVGELSVLFRLEGDFENALEYKKRELDIELSHGHLKYLPQTEYGIGATFYEMGELDSAKIYFERSLRTSNLYTVRGAYKSLYLISSAQGFYREAIEYNKCFHLYNDSILNMENAKVTAEIQTKYDNEKLENERKDLLLGNDKLQRYLLWGGILFVVFIGFVAFLYQRKLWLKERLMRKTQEDVQMYLSKLHENEVAIQYNQELIQTYSNELEEKGQLEYLVNEQMDQINQLRNKNEALQMQKSDFQEKIDEYIQSLEEKNEGVLLIDELSSQNLNLKNRVSLLMDYLNKHVDLFKNLRANPHYIEDWTPIIEHLDFLYDHFYQRLKNEYPTLTIADLQVCCLIKLKYTTSEIAMMTAVSGPSVTKKKYRIRERMSQLKKGLLKDEMTLEMYLKNY